MSDAILVLNAGSSSLKFTEFLVRDGEALEAGVTGELEELYGRARFHAKDAKGATIGEHATVGPFAHLRPGTELGPEVHVGNFVETKQARLGRGSKANHLAYLGDSIIGSKVNVGAGTITCNYNGYEKRQTIIEDGAFIGSDTQLVAPVRVGQRAVVAAGTTVVEDVAPGALAISRVPCKQVAGYADKLAKRYGAPGTR